MTASVLEQDPKIKVGKQNAVYYDRCFVILNSVIFSNFYLFIINSVLFSNFYLFIINSVRFNLQPFTCLGRFRAWFCVNMAIPVDLMTRSRHKRLKLIILSQYKTCANFDGIFSFLSFFFFFFFFFLFFFFFFFSRSFFVLFCFLVFNFSLKK